VVVAGGTGFFESVGGLSLGRGGADVGSDGVTNFSGGAESISSSVEEPSKSLGATSTTASPTMNTTVVMMRRDVTTKIRLPQGTLFISDHRRPRKASVGVGHSSLCRHRKPKDIHSTESSPHLWIAGGIGCRELCDSKKDDPQATAPAIWCFFQTVPALSHESHSSFASLCPRPQ
jgi:hypothetical protein